MKQLFYTCRNITGKFSAGLLCNLKILETRGPIDFLTTLKTDKGKNHIEQTVGIKINKTIDLYGDFYINQAVNMKDWKQVYDSLDVSGLKDYDSLHIMGGIHFPQSNLNRFSKRASIFPNDRGQLKFKQTGSHVINVLAMHKAHIIYDIPLHEFSYDCDELNAGMFQVTQNSEKYHVYHIYEMPNYNMKRLDCLQYFLLNSKKQETFFDFDDSANYDFIFGYTIFNYGNRPKYIDFVNEVASQFSNVKLLVKNTITGEDTTVSRDSYLKMVSNSKYTLILPSYDNNCFSLYRFMESIFNNCLPLIHSDCKIDEVEASFGIDLKQLVTTTAFTEERRIQILNDLKEKILVVEKYFAE